MDGCFHTEQSLSAPKSSAQIRQEMDRLQQELLEADAREREQSHLLREQRRLDEIARSRGYLNHQDLLDTNARVIGEETGLGFQNHAEFAAWSAVRRRQQSSLRESHIAANADAIAPLPTERAIKLVG